MAKKVVGAPVRLELSEEHARWLEAERLIPSELAAELGIVSSGRSIVFEYRRNGELLWLQRRIAKKANDGSLDKTFACYAPDNATTLSEAGIALSFWNEDDLTDVSSPDIPRIITEGQFDAASFKAAGATRVASVPNGAVDRMGEGAIDPFNDRQFQYLWRDGQLLPGLDTAKRIILATDDDKAGRVLREELAIRIGRPRCWYVTYPSQVIPELGRPCKDGNEVHKYLGLDTLMDVIADAKPMVPNRLVKFSEIPFRRQEAFSVGWRFLDRHVKVVRPELMVITGPPGDGKSLAALAIGANLAYEHGWPGAVIQFEDDIERNRSDLRKYWRYRSLETTRNLTDEELAEADAWIDRYFRTVSPTEDLEVESINLDWLDARLEEAATRHGARWAIVDPWNEIEHIFAKGQTEAQYLNQAVSRMKRLARRYQMMLMIVAHPDKAGGQETDIQQWSLYNMSGGAVWNNKADHGLIVLRPDNDAPECFWKIDKSKQHQLMGKPGIVRMRYSMANATYEFAGYWSDTPTKEES